MMYWPMTAEHSKPRSPAEALEMRYGPGAVSCALATCTPAHNPMHRSTSINGFNETRDCVLLLVGLSAARCAAVSLPAAVPMLGMATAAAAGSEHRPKAR